MRLVLLMALLAGTAAFAAYDRLGIADDEVVTAHAAATGSTHIEPALPARFDPDVTSGSPAALVHTPEQAPKHAWSGLALAELSATLERPLFEPTRRPPPPAPQHQQPIALPKPATKPVAPRQRPHVGFEVVGIVGERTRLRAVLVDAGNKETRSVAAGDRIGGWIVSQITRSGVALRQDEWTETISLFSTERRSQAAQRNARDGNDIAADDDDEGGEIRKPKAERAVGKSRS